LYEFSFVGVEGCFDGVDSVEEVELMLIFFGGGVVIGRKEKKFNSGC
jgi:hypothetical protein